MSGKCLDDGDHLCQTLTQVPVIDIWTTEHLGHVPHQDVQEEVKTGSDGDGRHQSGEHLGEDQTASEVEFVGDHSIEPISWRG